MEIEEPTVEALVKHAERQTKATEGMYVLAQVWSTLTAIGLVLLVIWLIAS